MSAAPLRADRPWISRGAGAVGLAAVVVLAGAGAFAPSIVLAGWLIAFATLGGVALGCVAWRAIHALTGGRWGEVGQGTLRGGSAVLPLTLPFALPLILAAGWLYPWAADPGSLPRDVAHVYLNGWSVALRSLVLLGGLTALIWRGRNGSPSPLEAAAMLLLYGGLMNFVAFDWLLSLDPTYTSSAFGMQVIAAQLLSAVCLMIFATEAPASDRVWGDYGGLLLACLLGEGYLLLMTFVVHWYGDLPDQAAWYLRRTGGAWRWLTVFGALVGLIGPGLALLFSSVRGSRARLRVTAGAICVGIVVENIWLVAPSAGRHGGWTVLVALAALVACGSLGLAFADRRDRAGRADAAGVLHV